MSAIIKKPVAILISGNGSNLQSLIDVCVNPDFPARIVLVISNKAEAYGLKRAEAAKIPTAVINHKDYADRESFDTALHEVIVAGKAEYVCLAGFMRLLTPGIVQKWQGRMLNIHPALLPSFKGINTHERALEAGVKIHGCTVHHVVPEMDSGPIILQAALPVLPDDTAETLGKRVLALEHMIYPLALSQVITGRKSNVAGSKDYIIS